MRAMVQGSHFLSAGGNPPECRAVSGALPDATRLRGYWATDKANSVGGIRLSQEHSVYGPVWGAQRAAVSRWLSDRDTAAAY